MAVNHVEPDEQRDAEARILDRDALHLVDRARSHDVQQVADRAVADGVGGVARDHGPRDRVAGGRHGQLAELLGQRHLGPSAYRCGGSFAEKATIQHPSLVREDALAGSSKRDGKKPRAGSGQKRSLPKAGARAEPAAFTKSGAGIELAALTEPDALAGLADDALLEAVQRQTFNFFWAGRAPIQCPGAGPPHHA